MPELPLYYLDGRPLWISLNPSAQVFSQQMLRFEEFGPVPLGEEASVVPGAVFPSPEADPGVPIPALT